MTKSFLFYTRLVSIYEYFVSSRVVILSKVSAKKYQKKIERHFDRLLSTPIKFFPVLVLHEDGITRFRRCFQNCVRLLLSEDPSKAAELIGGFIVALEITAGEYSI